jgi:aspartokinase-like uncharacterized kinase
MSHPPTVLKLGGSLLDWPELPRRLSADLDARRSQGDRLVLIVGGGRAADLVRELDRLHALGDDRAHRLALRALDFTAYTLSLLVPGLEVVSGRETLQRLWKTGLIPVLTPRAFLDTEDDGTDNPLPRDWDVTTDSIAARMAERLGAWALVLFKSAPLPSGTDRREAARLGLVDPAFPNLARGLSRVFYRNLRDPEASDMPLP